MSDKNFLTRLVPLLLLVLAVLLAMRFLPDISLGGHALRRVDILADVRRPKPAPQEADSLPLPPPIVRPAFADTCPEGKTCIEEYGDSTMRGMLPFYRALDRLSGGTSQTVRIAFFGDSFIEADIFTADLRALLQQHYGGCGVGFVTVTSPVNGFRRTVRHHFGGWQSHSLTDTLHYERAFLGVSGHYFIPDEGAFVELHGQSDYASRLDTCQRASLFFLNRKEARLTACVNGSRTQTRTFVPTDRLQEWTVEGDIGSVRWTVEEADSALFYGAAMDGAAGIVLDNFSLRGSSGLSLCNIPEQAMRDFNRLRPYDLIVLQYGLNVATERGRDYSKYAAGMNQTIERLKATFPQAGILIVSVGDRDFRTEEGDVRTMPGIRNLVRYQQQLAADNGVAFWNLFRSMGGNESMVSLVEAEPPLANHDYTHINFRGGKKLAGLLYEALIYGKEQYDRRRAYEETR